MGSTSSTVQRPVWPCVQCAIFRSFKSTWDERFLDFWIQRHYHPDSSELLIAPMDPDLRTVVVWLHFQRTDIVSTLDRLGDVGSSEDDLLLPSMRKEVRKGQYETLVGRLYRCAHSPEGSNLSRRHRIGYLWVLKLVNTLALLDNPFNVPEDNNIECRILYIGNDEYYFKGVGCSNLIFVRSDELKHYVKKNKGGIRCLC